MIVSWAKMKLSSGHARTPYFFVYCDTKVAIIFFTCKAGRFRDRLCIFERRIEEVMICQMDAAL